MSDMPSLCLIGAGRMGSALLRGWLARAILPSQISVIEPNPSPDLERLLNENGIGEPPDETPEVIVLAVKPQMLEEVLGRAAGLAGPDTCIVSIAAGRRIASFSEAFAPHASLVRALPNLAVEVGRGITGLYANANVSSEARHHVEKLFQSVGSVLWTSDEASMDAVTAVSGSGPAFIFYLVECLAEAAREAGLDAKTAMELARSTVVGAGELLHRLPLPAAQLRENVTSPAGTTAAGLSALIEANALRDLIVEAVARASRRSAELSSAPRN